MVIMNKNGYLEEVNTHRSYWIVRAKEKGKTGSVPITNIALPEQLVGKRVKFKVEVLK